MKKILVSAKTVESFMRSGQVQVCNGCGEKLLYDHTRDWHESWHKTLPEAGIAKGNVFKNHFTDETDLYCDDCTKELLNK